MWAWKGLRSMSSVFREITGSGANGSMLALDASGYGFESRLSECYGVYDVLVLLSMLVCGTSREGSNPSIPTIIPCQSSNGRVCKTLFHRCKSYRDVQKGWLAQLVRESVLHTECHRFKSYITHHNNIGI